MIPSGGETTNDRNKKKGLTLCTRAKWRMVVFVQRNCRFSKTKSIVSKLELAKGPFSLVVLFVPKYMYNRPIINAAVWFGVPCFSRSPPLAREDVQEITRPRYTYSFGAAPHRRKNLSHRAPFRAAGARVLQIYTSFHNLTIV